MNPNDTLMEQCRREAEERYPAPPYAPLPDGLDEIFGPDVRHIKQFAYAAALYAERSRPRTSLSLDEVMRCVDDEAWPARDRIEHDPMSGITDHFVRMVSGIHARLTEKLNELNTQTNG